MSKFSLRNEPDLCLPFFFKERKNRPRYKLKNRISFFDSLCCFQLSKFYPLCVGISLPFAIHTTILAIYTLYYYNRTIAYPANIQLWICHTAKHSQEATTKYPLHIISADVQMFTTLLYIFRKNICKKCYPHPAVHKESTYNLWYIAYLVNIAKNKKYCIVFKNLPWNAGEILIYFIYGPAPFAFLF